MICSYHKFDNTVALLALSVLFGIFVWQDAWWLLPFVILCWYVFFDQCRYMAYLRRNEMKFSEEGRE